MNFAISAYAGKIEYLSKNSLLALLGAHQHIKIEHGVMPP